MEHFLQELQKSGRTWDGKAVTGFPSLTSYGGRRCEPFGRPKWTRTPQIQRIVATPAARNLLVSFIRCTRRQFGHAVHRGSGIPISDVFLPTGPRLRFSRPDHDRSTASLPSPTIGSTPHRALALLDADQHRPGSFPITMGIEYLTGAGVPTESPEDEFISVGDAALVFHLRLTSPCACICG